MKTRRRRQKGSGQGCSTPRCSKQEGIKCTKDSSSSQKPPDEDYEDYEDWKMKNETIVDKYQKMSLDDISSIRWDIVSNTIYYGKNKNNHIQLLKEIMEKKVDEKKQKIMEDRRKETEKKANQQAAKEQTAKEQAAKEKIANYNSRNPSIADKTIGKTFGTKKGGNSKKTHKRKSRRQSK